MDKIIARINKMDTDMILICAQKIGGGDYTKLGKEERMVRAALIDVYEKREGEDAADALMDLLGM